MLAPADLAQLLRPAQGNAAAASYVSAVNALYVASQRQPVIDPDVIGPDDFRVPVHRRGRGGTSRSTCGSPGGTGSTRSWAALQTAQGSGSAPSFTGMLSWMQNHLTYGRSPRPRGPPPPR